MSRFARLERRLQLCEGHWELDELDEAMSALERASSEAPGDARVVALASRWLVEIDDLPVCDTVRERLVEVRDVKRPPRPAPVEAVPVAEASAESDLPRLATSTLAELLAAQGHSEQALRVAEDVLRKSPGDPRARAVRERLSQPDPGPLPEPASRFEPEPVAAPEPEPAFALERAPKRGNERLIFELERWLANLEHLRARRADLHEGAIQ